MKNKITCNIIISLCFLFLLQASVKAQLLDNFLSSSDMNKKSGSTVVTSDTMDIDMKNNVVTLTGNVVIEDNNNKITADKIDMFLEDSEDNTQDEKSNDKLKDKLVSKRGGKEARNIVATGNVVILRKAITMEEKTQGEKKAMAGKADYNLKTGLIVLTEHPVLYRGNDYIRGRAITLWRDNDRMKVEGDQSTGQISKLVLAADNTLTQETPSDTEKKSESLKTNNQY